MTSDDTRCAACGTPWHPSTGGLHKVDKTDRLVAFCGPCERDLAAFVKFQTSRKEKANPNAMRAGAKRKSVGMHERVAELRALVERKGLPVGTHRKWQSGEVVKRPDGTWATVPVAAAPHAALPAPAKSKHIRHRYIAPAETPQTNRYQADAPRGVTKTPEFKKWFGDSKCVDDEGRPLVVYHGTTSPEDFAAFNAAKHGGENTADTFRESAKLGTWFLAGDMARRASFIGGGRYWDRMGSGEQQIDKNTEHARVLPVHLSIQKPFVIRPIPGRLAHPEMAKDVPPGTDGLAYAALLGGTRGGVDAMVRLVRRVQQAGGAEAFKKKLRAAGYDGIRIVGSHDAFFAGADQWVAFEPEQAKSVFNRGTWDSTSPNMNERKTE